MRQRVMLPLMLVCAGLPLGAQELTPEVIGSAGDFDAGAVVKLAWTIGEPVIHTLGEGSMVLTQGFHQPMAELLDAASVPVAGEAAEGAMLYPNPFRTQMFIRVPASWKYFDLEIVNSYGDVVMERQRVERDRCAVDFTTLPSGTYIARIWTRDAAVPVTHQVTKVE